MVYPRTLSDNKPIRNSLPISEYPECARNKGQVKISKRK